MTSKYGSFSPKIFDNFFSAILRQKGKKEGLGGKGLNYRVTIFFLFPSIYKYFSVACLLPEKCGLLCKPAQAAKIMQIFQAIKYRDRERERERERERK